MMKKDMVRDSDELLAQQLVRILRKYFVTNLRDSFFFNFKFSRKYVLLENMLLEYHF